MNLLNNLLEQAKRDRLAHFYIVEAPGPLEKSFTDLMNFVHSFIKNYYQKQEGHKQSLINLMDHPDVYVLGNTSLEEKEGPPFTVEEAEAFARFFEFKPVQGQRKFAIITEGHRINTLVANKWLKLLEEPQGQSTIFLLNPRRQKLLETIHSRAIHLRLFPTPTSEASEEWIQFLQVTKNMGLAQFLEANVKGEKELSYWVNELIRWESEQETQLESKMALQNWLKTYQEMEIFHQSKTTQWTLFFGHLTQHVLPRFH